MNPTEKPRKRSKDLYETLPGKMCTPILVDDAIAKIEAALIETRNEAIDRCRNLACNPPLEFSQEKYDALGWFYEESEKLYAIRSLIVPKGDSKEWQHDLRAQWPNPKGDV